MFGLSGSLIKRDSSLEKKQKKRANVITVGGRRRGKKTKIWKVNLKWRIEGTRVEGQITNEDAGLRIREMRLLPFAYNRRNNLKEELWKIARGKKVTRNYISKYSSFHLIFSPLSPHKSIIHIYLFSVWKIFIQFKEKFNALIHSNKRYAMNFASFSLLNKKRTL